MPYPEGYFSSSRLDRSLNTIKPLYCAHLGQLSFTCDNEELTRKVVGSLKKLMSEAGVRLTGELYASKPDA